MQAVTLNEEGLKNFVEDYEFEMMKDKIKEATDKLNNKNGEGRDMLGWLDLPEKITDEQILDIIRYYTKKRIVF